MKNKTMFYCVVLAQIAVLVFMILSNLAIINTGERILLKTRPIDPRSLFAGDYVTLGYDISEVNLENVQNDFNVDIKRYKDEFIRQQSPVYERNYKQYNPNKNITNRIVYVTLSKKAGEEYYTPDSVTFKKPSKDKLFIKGRLEYIRCQNKNSEWGAYKKDEYGNDVLKTAEDIEAEVSIDYKSIDTYYVPEGTGHDVEQQFRDNRELHLVEVAVDKGGDARVTGIK